MNLRNSRSSQRGKFVPLEEGSSLLVKFEKVRFPVIWSQVPETTLPLRELYKRLYGKTVSLKAESKLTLHDYS